MQFIANPNRVYSFRKAMEVINTAVLFRRDTTVEARMHDKKLITIRYNSYFHEVTLEGPLTDGNRRSYSTRVTVGNDDLYDIVLALNECNEHDLRNNEESKLGGTVQAAETNWSDPFGW